jgi:hypothetical protein
VPWFCGGGGPHRLLAELEDGAEERAYAVERFLQRACGCGGLIDRRKQPL